MTDPPPITQHGDGVLIRGPALALVYRALHALIIRYHRDGVAVSPLLNEARRIVYRATMSARGHEIDTTTSTESGCGGQYGDDLIDSAEAAALLGVSVRQARRLVAADPLLGGRCGSIWLLRRSAVLALAERRRNDKLPNGIPEYLAGGTTVGRTGGTQ